MPSYMPTGYYDTTKPILPAPVPTSASGPIQASTVPNLQGVFSQYPGLTPEALGFQNDINPVDQFINTLDPSIDRNDPLAILRAAGAGNPDLSSAIVDRFGIQNAGDLTFSNPYKQGFGEFLKQGIKTVAPYVGLGLGLSALFPGAAASAGSAAAGTAGAGMASPAGTLIPGGIGQAALDAGAALQAGAAGTSALAPVALPNIAAIAPATVAAGGSVGGAATGGGLWNTVQNILGVGGGGADAASNLPKWAQVLTGAIGPASAAYGAYQQGQAQEDALNFARGGQLPPLNFNIGGISATDTGADLGPWANLYQSLIGGAEGVPMGNAQSARDAALANLRASALPENQRAVNTAFTRLFSEGRLGSTGGANILGRLAEAQNQQDLGFQLAAGQEGRAEMGANQAALQAYLGGAGDILGFGGGAFTSALNRAEAASNAYSGVASNINQAVFGGRYNASPMAMVMASLFPPRGA